MKTKSLTLQPLAWHDSPVDVFHELSHLANPVFLDTSGNLPHDARAPHSLISANPEEIITGHLNNPEDFALFSDKYRSSLQTGPDSGLPLGAWMGTLDYEGHFWFGLYRNLLLYSHHSGEWHEAGGSELSLLRKKSSLLTPASFHSWQSNFTREEFESRVASAKDYITAGDIYQVNLSQRFQAKVEGSSLLPHYERLRFASPAPMSGYLDTGAHEILSSSPELFLRFCGQQVEARPIKGTRPRFDDSATDLRSSHELKTSEKEMAELLMITDLLRNDLGRICKFGSVSVKALAQLESLAQVHHLVSTITGTLQPEINHLEAFASCSPGGSVTGAPKKRACEIIAELETVPRGFYTGSLGYFGLNGESQFNILIRSLVHDKAAGLAHYHVGSGIVADSTPAAEYDETLHKAKGLRLALALE